MLKMFKILKENQDNPQIHNNDGQKTPSISLYERSREERIKENLQRMQKLGIFDLSLKLKAAVHSKRTPKHSPSDSQRSTPARPSGPLRRSSRLQNATPVSYSEATLSKKDKGLEDENVKLQEGSKPEVYTEEHEKLLGNTERAWTLFVDGYGKDGRRIYDSVKGKTCHQCRQKTLGHRTHCSKCNMVQGQFCGDCLYMRYGEHVLEAIEKPNWICPVCRGICNCSLCRQAKGWCPTGTLYRKISSLGFKSVAHYLIQTRLAQTTLETSPETVNKSSAKRSLSFCDREAFSKDSPKIIEKKQEKLEPQSEDVKADDDLNIEKEIEMQGNRFPSTNHQNSTKRSLDFLNIEAGKERKMQGNRFLSTNHQNSTKRSLDFLNIESGFQNTDSIEVDLKIQNHCDLSHPELEDNMDNGFKGEQKKKLHYHGSDHNDMELPLVEKNLDVKQAVSSFVSDEGQKQVEQEKKLHYTDVEHNDSDTASECCQNPKRKRATIEPSQDSIAGRLKRRRRKDNDSNDMELLLVNEKSFEVKQVVINILSDTEKEMAITDDKLGDRTSDVTTKLSRKPAFPANPDQDLITGRSRQMEKEGDTEINLASSTAPTHPTVLLED